MHKFKDLVVWQKGFAIGLKVLKLSKQFPKSEQFGLTSQLNRSAISIASNIAEGAGRASKKEFSQFLSIAIGSSYEMETQLMFAIELGYATQEQVNEITAELFSLQRMLRKFKEHLTGENQYQN
jgi:four helix bundle protein